MLLLQTNDLDALYRKGLNLEVERLEASVIEKSLAIHIHEDCIKKLNEKILMLRGDCAHWERKSVSGSKELLRLNNLEQVYAMQENSDLINKNFALKIKLKVIMSVIMSAQYDIGPSVDIKSSTLFLVTGGSYQRHLETIFISAKNIRNSILKAISMCQHKILHFRAEKKSKIDYSHQ